MAGHTWESNRWDGSENIYIEPNDLLKDNFTTGTYYISVYGYESTVFSITADSYKVDAGRNRVVLYNAFPQVQYLV